jgi:hypothetical protein
MPSKMRFLAILLVLVTGIHPQSPKLPSFKEFQAAEGFSGKPAAPVLRTPNQRLFRTMIRQGAATGPNFAGHYTIADWGCGAGCVSIAVADAKDGRSTTARSRRCPGRWLSMKANTRPTPRSLCRWNSTPIADC